MREFSPNCFEKVSYEQHQAITPESCTLMPSWTTSQNTGCPPSARLRRAVCGGGRRTRLVTLDDYALVVAADGGLTQRVSIARFRHDAYQQETADCAGLATRSTPLR